ncbi:MAG: branched-chain amino acid ABC transporter permease [Tepidiformaceae bacterium]
MREFRSRLPHLPEWAHALIFLVVGLTGLALLDDTWIRVLFLVTLYATLGMGLNVVVGLAGLLDLGFVAFFATGAYVVAIWGAPISPSVDGVINYWILLPLAVLIGASVGLMLGLPVLPLRGDYLAIVTLGFGEIIRILALNLNDITRGSSGIFEIERPSYGFGEVDNVRKFFVMILLAALLVWFVTSRLRDSKIGRAWEAIREDEDVAAGMGINTTRYKLMAFAMGASIGALGGAIYAPFIDFIAPQQFGLIVSINVLGLVIIGGMGNTSGVIAGSVLLIGVPELLQFQETAELLQKFGWLRDLLNTVIDGFNAISFADIGKLPPAEDWGEKLAMYRFIVFGALLVIVMALRPSGLFPSRRRELEFDAEYQEPEGVA